MSTAVGVGLGLAELPARSGRVEVTVLVPGGSAAESGLVRYRVSVEEIGISSGCT